MEETKSPVKTKKKSSSLRSLAWTTRNISQTISILIVAYISYFCTDVLGMNIGIVGTLLLASKVIDAITDLGAGYLIDRTHTRFGKARPYEMFIIFQWLTTVLMFAAPNASRTVQYIFVFIMYVLANAVCMTALGAADSVYLARAFTTDEDRTKALSITGIFVMVVSIVFNIIFPQFVNSAAGATQAGWVKITALIGAPLTLIGILRFFFVKEVVKDDAVTESRGAVEKKNDLSIGQSAGLLLKNKYALIVIALMFITYFINNMSTINTYYFKYLMGDVGLLSLVGLTALITPILLIFFPVLSKKIGSTRIMRACFLIGIIGMAIRTIGGQNMTTVMVGSLFSTVAVIPISVMINIYLIECMDYGEWVNGTRIEGLVASTSNFAGKLGSALSSGVVGILVLFGYDGTLEVQSAAANNAIFALYNVLPLILYIVMFVLALMYKMDDVRPQMMADLAKKHEGN